MLQINAFTQNDLPGVAMQIISFLGDEKIILFYGNMGAGKTTLIKALCEALGVKESVTSPTFSIVNQYTGLHADIYHFDFYRLKNQYEALDIGFEEYLQSGNYCFIEWPEKIDNLLPEKYFSIKIMEEENNLRTIVVQFYNFD